MGILTTVGYSQSDFNLSIAIVLKRGWPGGAVVRNANCGCFQASLRWFWKFVHSLLTKISFFLIHYFFCCWSDKLGGWSTIGDSNSWYEIGMPQSWSVELHSLGKRICRHRYFEKHHLVWHICVFSTIVLELNIYIRSLIMLILTIFIHLSD